MNDLTNGAIPLTVVVLTYNEERNLPDCLASVAGWAGEVFVVDSGSADATAEIARRQGAVVVEHGFETHARQWKWALENLPIAFEWVLGLDADQRVTRELRDEIAQLLRDPKATQLNGCYVRRRQVFRGKWIKHGGYYPKHLLKLFRRGCAHASEADLVDHHFRVDGPVAILRGDLIEDNRNEAEISVWVDKHNRYAVLQAQEEMRRDGWPVEPSLWGTPDERTMWLKRLWRGLPLYVRPLLYFLYRYVVRLGFLDGKEGFVFHFLQAFWYRLLVDVNLDELRRSQRAAERKPTYVQCETTSRSSEV